MRFLKHPPVSRLIHSGKRLSRTLLLAAGLLLASAFTPLSLHGQVPACSYAIPYPDEAALHSPFIDSLLRTMSLEDLAAQTLVLRSQAVPTEAYLSKMRKLLGSRTFGGVCFFAGETPGMLALQQAYKAASRLPLFMTIDGEFGPGMRMTDLDRFPRQQTLGAIQDENLVFRTGQENGRQCRLLGLQWNFLPVADVNNNPLNPVINTRSFGQDPQKTARLAGLYLQGLQSQGVMGSAKHFPGHGDTETDSHLALPVINLDRKTLDSIHLYPFKKLIAQGVESIMVAHLNLPAYDSSGLPASLSPAIIKELLRDELGYQGLVVTDGLEMQAVRKALQELPQFKELGEGSIEVAALAAGCDVLLLPVDPEAAVKAIAKAVETGRLEKSRLEEACRRILYYKFYPSVARNYARYPDTSLLGDLQGFLRDSINSQSSKALRQSLYEHGITLLENTGQLLPLSPWSFPRKIALHIGYGKPDEFSRSLSRFDTGMEQVFLHRDFDYERTVTPAFLEQFSRQDLIIASITHTNYLPSRNYGITPQTLALLEALQKEGIPVVLCVFAPPYSLKPFHEMSCMGAILCGYQDVDESKRACARILYGAVPASGKLPVTVAKYWPEGFGLETRRQILDFHNPLFPGLEDWQREKIDSLARAGLEAHAYPGCQILIALDGTVAYDRCFGRAAYEEGSPEVQANSLYDLASLTKILATTLSYMRLYDNGDFLLDQAVCDFIPRLARTDKRHITFRQLLAHQSGLKAFIPYADPEEEKDEPLFQAEESPGYPLQVADSLYLRKGYGKEIRKRIDQSPVNSRRPYRYSDLGFYYLNEALQAMTDTTLSAYSESEFYRFLGLQNLCFRPLDRFPRCQVMPTENDTSFRKRQIHGFVHDPLAALSGGEAGSAGLFGNSHDVAVIGQMLLQCGFYGGIQFFDSATVRLFTSSDFSPAGNRRGGGFDKPTLEKDEPSPACPSASASSFGHSGFTGTYLWVDPEIGLVYVFLSNRVYPDMHNSKLVSMGIRTAIMEVLYHQAPFSLEEEASPKSSPKPSQKSDRKSQQDF